MRLLKDLKLNMLVSLRKNHLVVVLLFILLRVGLEIVIIEWLLLEGYKYDSETIKLVKPQESLAQVLANHLDATVYAYLKRSNYTSSWLDGEINCILRIT